MKLVLEQGDQESTLTNEKWLEVLDLFMPEKKKKLHRDRAAFSKFRRVTDSREVNTSSISMLERRDRGYKPAMSKTF